MEDWKTYRLEEIAEYISRGVTPSYADDGILVVNQRCIRDGRVNYTHCRYTDHAKKKVPMEKLLKPFDILINSTGQGTLGRVGQVKTIDEPTTVDSHVTIVRVEKGFDPIYVGYFLKWNQPVIENLAEGTTGQTELPRHKVADLLIKAPNLPTQNAIAEILSSLDDKIELNNQINQNLEALAQAIFKRWFVDFEFPDENGQPYKSSGGEMVESELGEIPTKCSIGKVLDLFELQRGYDLPSKKRIKGTVPIYSAGGINGYHIEAKVQAPGITTGRSGVIGNVYLVLEDFWPLNTSLYIKTFKISNPYHSYFFLKSLDLRALNAGSAVPTLNRNDVHALRTIVPPQHLVANYQDVTRPMFDLIALNVAENARLATLRDNLLPKLITGSIPITKSKIDFMNVTTA